MQQFDNEVKINLDKGVVFFGKNWIWNFT